MGDIPVMNKTSGLLTVSDYVKAFKRADDAWGVEGYYVPVRDNFYKTEA